VYDSKTGKSLLIPQGTILIASYNSSVSFAQSRVQIVWNTLIRPDGFSVDLGGMNAVDGEGYSGVKGRYSENLFQYAKAMGIVSLFSILNGQVSQTLDAANNTRYQDMIAANQNVVNQLGARIIDKALDIQPTITVKNGAAINVMLNKHLQLPPVDDYEVTAKYVRR
jgi:type IV secretion system protein VirB10